MRDFIVKAALFSSLICFVDTFAAAQEHKHGHSAAEMNKRFEKPDLDVGRFIQQFETDSREIYSQRTKLVEVVGLHPGMAVADVGAGTGLFTWLFAEKVGPKGTVYAVEIAPAFLKHIEEQAARRGLGKVVKPVRSTQDSTHLAPGSVDVAFVCATYHHFEHPKKLLKSIHQALRPGGRLVVVDFDLRKDSGDFVRTHARAPKETYFGEIKAAGFSQLAVRPSLNLKDNFIAVFQRDGSVVQPPPAGR